MTCVYIIRDGSLVKIGMSDRPRQRRGGIKATGAVCPVLIAAWEAGKTRADAFAVEQKTHWVLRARWMHGEWFEATNVEAELAIRTAAVMLQIPLAEPRPMVRPRKPARSRLILPPPQPVAELLEAAVQSCMQKFAMTREEIERAIYAKVKPWQPLPEMRGRMK